jgi:hypothetical protein
MVTHPKKDEREMPFMYLLTRFSLVSESKVDASINIFLAWWNVISFILFQYVLGGRPFQTESDNDEFSIRMKYDKIWFPVVVQLFAVNGN